ncbi:Pre-mRNA-splicing factor cwf19 [Taxawa tesnikishii (nom. ined.)]|nr:Pre-mRNA-splicing factor cwf19 [Dothideales sp. JES 119]
MGLEDFERELAASKTESSRKSRDRSRDRGSDRHRHRHHHRSSRHGDSRDDEERRRDKRPRHHRDREDDERKHRAKRRRSESPRPARASAAHEEDEEDEWVEKEAMTAPPTEDIADERDENQRDEHLKRDTWMEAPASLDVDYVQRNNRRKEPQSQFVAASSSKEEHEKKIHKHDIEQLMKDLEEDGEKDDDRVRDEPAQHEVTYTFGDSGSNWRMTKLQGVYRRAKEAGIPAEDIALETYGDLRDFDDAREEERELDRRKMYGKDYVGLEKPSGELFQERKMRAGIHRKSPATNVREREEQIPSTQGHTIEEAPPPARTAILDQTALNKLKAQMMKAKLRSAPNAAALEAEYSAAAAAAANSKQPDVVVLGTMENRMLAGGRGGEVKAIDNKRGRERGLVEENEDMSIEDMVRQEKRTRGLAGGEGRAFAERIAKDAKFDNDLDYMDDNANKLARKVAKSDINLRNVAIGDFQKMQRILENCPLCHHEDTNTPPAAPVVSLATRVYMTLPTEPEVSSGGAVIVPVQHRLNLLECDDDEWEEIRNFMKSLTRMYHERDRGVIFYENAAQMHSRKHHAALVAVPLPMHLASDAPAFFKEAILSSDEEWSQHKRSSIRWR